MPAGAIGQFAVGQFKPADDSAVISTTLGALTSSIAAQVIVSAHISTTLDGLTSSITGQVIVSGRIETTLEPLTSADAGEVIVNGTISSTLGDLTSNITGTVKPGPFWDIRLGEQQVALPVKIYARTQIVGKSVVQAFGKDRVNSKVDISGASITDFIIRARVSAKFEVQSQNPSLPVVAYAKLVDHGWVKRDTIIRRNNNLLLMS